MPNLKFPPQTVPEIWRRSQNSKSSHVTPLRSVSRGPALTLYLDSSIPICLFTIQLSLSYDDDELKFSVPSKIRPKFPFWGENWVEM